MKSVTLPSDFGTPKPSGTRCSYVWTRMKSMPWTTKHPRLKLPRFHQVRRLHIRVSTKNLSIYPNETRDTPSPDAPEDSNNRRNIPDDIVSSVQIVVKKDTQCYPHSTLRRCQQSSYPLRNPPEKFQREDQGLITPSSTASHCQVLMTKTPVRLMLTTMRIRFPLLTTTSSTSPVPLGFGLWVTLFNLHTLLVWSRPSTVNR